MPSKNKEKRFCLLGIAVSFSNLNKNSRSRLSKQIISFDQKKFTTKKLQQHASLTIPNGIQTHRCLHTKGFVISATKCSNTRP
jgi:hypothetical protein